MQSKATSVRAYLAGLPAERREALEAVRGVILENLDEGYEEGMQYGMIGYYVPHSVYPPGYHCDARQPLPFAALASQKNHMSLYLMCVYGVPAHDAWFRRAWTATGKRLDMGKGCVRFKRLEDVPLEVVGETIRRVPSREFVAYYESVRPGGPKAGAAAPEKKAGAKKAGAGKKSPKKAGAKKIAKKTAKKAAKKSTKKAAARGGVKKAAKKTSKKASGRSRG